MFEKLCDMQEGVECCPTVWSSLLGGGLVGNSTHDLASFTLLELQLCCVESLCDQELVHLEVRVVSSMLPISTHNSFRASQGGLLGRKYSP